MFCGTPVEEHCYTWLFSTLSNVNKSVNLHVSNRKTFQQTARKSKAKLCKNPREKVELQMVRMLIKF